VRLPEIFRHLSRQAQIDHRSPVVSRLAKSGIFLPEFHVPDFSRFLQHREMRVQRSGIFLSSSDFSLLSSWGGE
jgi:hypothetical protein